LSWRDAARLMAAEFGDRGVTCSRKMTASIGPVSLVVDGCGQ
jgi:hypothetical protein